MISTNGESAEIIEIPQIPCSLPPDEVLARFTAELGHPINSIIGCVRILQEPTYQDRHYEMVRHISDVATRMEELRTVVKNYLRECFGHSIP